MTLKSDYKTISSYGVGLFHEKHYWNFGSGRKGNSFGKSVEWIQDNGGFNILHMSGRLKLTSQQILHIMIDDDIRIDDGLRKTEF